MKRIVAFSVALSVGALASGSAVTLNSWSSKMQGLAFTTNALLPILASRNPDRQALLKHSKSLADLSHALTADAAAKMKLPPGDADPSLPLIAGEFEAETRRAYRAIKGGHGDYGVNLLRSMTSYCIACHTRHDGGAGAAGISFAPEMKSLSRVEKADLLVALRQFDKAFSEYAAVVADNAVAKREQIEWDRAVRRGLTVAVRVKNDPDAASRIIDKVLAQSAAPEFLRRSAIQWKASVARWKTEPAAAVDASESTLYERMNRYVREAQSAQAYPADLGGNVEYLRASSAAHELLSRYPDGKYAAEALFVAGLACDVTSDPSLWSFHERYYEACVRKAPHSPMAERCYGRFEASTYVGYSGSGGTFLPDDVAAKLRELRALAKAPGTVAP